MQSRLNEVERVRDVFIPKWVNREGKRFGFVRFCSNIDKIRVEQELNDIWFGNYKLRANLSRFDRKFGPNKAEYHPKPIYFGSSNPDHGNAWRKSDISYAEVVRGSLRQSNTNMMVKHQQDDNNFAGLRYGSTEEYRERLKKYFTGILKENFLWIDVGNNIKEACDGHLTINYLGGNLVLIHATSDAGIQDKDLECIDYWFESIRPWSEDDVDNR
ncbi:hypothetical protein ACS0TY_032461 [Phlomoides rotata]